MNGCRRKLVIVIFSAGSAFNMSSAMADSAALYSG